MESQDLHIFLNVLLFSSTFLQFSTAGDTLGPNQFLADGETLVSTSQRFELGFFSPGSSKNWYLGTSGDGSLVLVNGKQNLVWSSSPSQVPTDKPFLQLLDSGILYFPGRQKWVLKATYGRALITRVIQDYQSTAPGHGMDFDSVVIPEPMIQFFEPILEFKEDLLISLYERNSSIISRSILTQSGFLQHYILNQQSSTWDLMHTAPNDACDNYEHCGPNGICRINRTLVKLPDLLEFRKTISMRLKECKQQCLMTCSCIAYASSNISDGSGCSMWFGDLIDTREFLQGDSQQDFYIRLVAFGNGKIKMGSESYLWQSFDYPCDTRLPESTKQWHAECLKGFTLKFPQEWEASYWANGCVRTVPLDCKDAEEFVKLHRSSCRTSWSFGKTLVGCSMWFGDLIDTREFLQGDSQQDFYIRLAASVNDATSNFSCEHMIGEGGFGPVYKEPSSSFWDAASKEKKGC
ncbi:leucine-rich repeat transmembrane protein kinase [Actinidia rufa]|uniref:Leucine-rich repeat transmembrane protein kinase n=1 Tax=Actinidia rufa TaxID=165716 RepID=A0A7J0GNR5_9ERIC|nr:leucine-rich repeat transmembrane protein kinase [Actinidia rufa]